MARLSTTSLLAMGLQLRSSSWVPSSLFRTINVVRPFSDKIAAAASFSSKPDSEKDNRLFPEEINILYDSKCNVCKWEMEWLKRRDRDVVNISAPRIRLTDLEDPSFDPMDPANGGITYERGMRAMTAVTADGKVHEGVPVFRLAYQQVGLGWLFTATQWPVLKTLFDFGYTVFAKYRTLVTRGTRIDTLISSYEERKELERSLKEDSCETCKS